MSRRVLWSLAGLVTVVLAAWLFLPRATAVEVHTVQRGEATRVLAVNGRIRPRLSIDVQSPVAGKLILLPHDVGHKISQGTLLAAIDDAPQRAAIKQAEALLVAQREALAQARRDLTRYENLAEVIGSQRVEQARLAARQAQDEVSRLAASVEQAREVQARHQIRAPFSGVITERPVDPGQTVSSETVLYRLADTSAPEVTAQVDELYAAELSIGTPAIISLPGMPRPLSAKISIIEERVDPQTGARSVRLRFDEALASAPAGLTVSVNLIVDRRQDAISIPRAAILNPTSNPAVRMVDGDGVVSSRQIKFLDWPAEKVIVTSGLDPGMRILVDPRAAEPGQHVRVVQ